MKREEIMQRDREGKVMEDNLENFTKEILGKYNATPDEWDHFEVVKDTRATDPLLKQMAEALERLLYGVEECDRVSSGRIEGAAYALQAYHDHINQIEKLASKKGR